MHENNIEEEGSVWFSPGRGLGPKGLNLDPVRLHLDRTIAINICFLPININ